ncbi:ABC transporter permease [Neptunomonas antarctica]|uniref:Putative spermidine/putrescine transport system permease protein n=1 Tax=Neptunomonas antarctica TaxID=619304 RepID=A0A1N7IXU0_9GAMM|nr:ABC transporter permease [Neptunomonas antarctica]SIS41864.1 putative spermidine/putrescine transport system permease protein [Neptunomonas antarctica]
MFTKLTRPLFLMMLPVLIITCTFLLIPMFRLVVISISGEDGLMIYWHALSDARYLQSLLDTLFLSVLVTLVTLAIAVISGLFLSRNHFPGKSVLISLLTFPLAFPGVVVGFLVIMLGGRQGLSAELGLFLDDTRWTFAYSIVGLFVGYIYFSIPRVLLTVIAAVEKMDMMLEEAARSLGASRLRVFIDVIIPALKPALIASGAICFATSMGAFGTAFALASGINVMPMTIYTEFTLGANIAMAASLSIILGLITWLVLLLARSVSGANTSPAA